MAEGVKIGGVVLFASVDQRLGDHDGDEPEPHDHCHCNPVLASELPA